MNTCPICQSFTFHNSLFHTDKCTNCSWEDNHGYQREIVKKEVVEYLHFTQEISTVRSEENNKIDLLPLNDNPFRLSILNFGQFISSGYRFLFLQPKLEHVRS